MGQRMGKLQYGDESQECVVVCHEMVSMPWTKSPLHTASARGPCDGAWRGAPEVAGWASPARTLLPILIIINHVSIQNSGRPSRCRFF
jgi:hypothetical protein